MILGSMGHGKKGFPKMGWYLQSYENGPTSFPLPSESVWQRIIAGKARSFFIPNVGLVSGLIKGKSVVQNSELIQIPFGNEWHWEFLPTRSWCKLYLF